MLYISSDISRQGESRRATACATLYRLRGRAKPGSHQKRWSKHEMRSCLG